jgi:hypothetical protein
MKHTNAPYPVGLLCPRRKGPNSNRRANHFDEIAPAEAV